MKNLFLLFFVFFISFSFGQTKKNVLVTYCPEVEDNVISEDNNTIYNTAGIEVKPEFPGGSTKMYEFINNNFVKPEGKIIKGKVYVTFVVEKDGTLTNIKVLRDLGYGTGKEAIRVLKMMSKWLPGEQNGKKIRCTYSFPITIQ